MKTKILRKSNSSRNVQIVIQHCGCENVPAPVSPVFEKNSCLELQPAVYKGGWEYYRLISFSEKDLRKVFATLEEYCNLEIISRRAISSGAVKETMLVSTASLFGGLTRKQVQALVFALENGYYQVPKKVTTEEMASKLRLPRTTYEEHLRKAEGKVLRRQPLHQHEPGLTGLPHVGKNGKSRRRDLSPRPSPYERLSPQQWFALPGRATSALSRSRISAVETSRGLCARRTHGKSEIICGRRRTGNRNGEPNPGAGPQVAIEGAREGDAARREGLRLRSGCRRNPVAFARMDGAGVLSPDIARGKAYTAVASKSHSKEMAERMKDRPAAGLGLTQVSGNRIVLLPGGVLARKGNEIIGAVGVSGASSDEDHECGLEAVSN